MIFKWVLSAWPASVLYVVIVVVRQTFTRGQAEGMSGSTCSLKTASTATGCTSPRQGKADSSRAANTAPSGAVVCRFANRLFYHT